jgi:serine-type D-Ala-D-Ala carboxypeptidase/endopeptidase
VPWSELAERVDALLARHAGRHVGLVVGVRMGRETGFWHRGRLPDGPGTIFEIGSITKTFTATLLADMAGEGLVALDDPVQRHLPEGVRLPVRGRAITLEDLASHRSGLPRLPKGLLVPALTRDRRDPYGKFDEARLATAVGATRPRREPGRKVAYSNYGMGVLGYVLARRAGTSYERLVRARICEPLELVDTWIETPEPERRRLAAGQTWRGRPTPAWQLAALAGAGGLRSTARDLLAFLDLHTAGARSPQLARAAAEAARPRASLGRAEIGLGWLMIPPGRRLPWHRQRARALFHDGGTGGFRSFAGVIPERDASAVLLANQARSVTRLGLRVLDVLTG